LYYSVGVYTQLESLSPSCAGDEVMYNCTVRSGNHVWKVSGDLEAVNISISASVQEDRIGAFTFRLESGVNVNSIITSVSAVSNASLNGTVVTCGDGNEAPDEGEIQRTEIFVYGEFEGEC
jgi:hypothetical protein